MKYRNFSEEMQEKDLKRSIGNNISGYYLLWIQKDGKRNKNLF